MSDTEPICSFCGASRKDSRDWNLCTWCANPENKGAAPGSPKAEGEARHARYLANLGKTNV